MHIIVFIKMALIKQWSEIKGETYPCILTQFCCGNGFKPKHANFNNTSNKKIMHKMSLLTLLNFVFVLKSHTFRHVKIKGLMFYWQNKSRQEVQERCHQLTPRLEDFKSSIIISPSWKQKIETLKSVDTTANYVCY